MILGYPGDILGDHDSKQQLYDITVSTIGA